jgi:hypothetical protein
MEPLPIDEAFDAESDRLHDAERDLELPGTRHHAHEWHSYLARSRYDEQLARYLARFPRSHILVSRSEDLFSTSGPAWARIQTFLGLPVLAPPPVLPHSNRGASEGATVAPELRQRLRERLDPTYQALRQEYGIAWQAAVAPHVTHAC